MTAAGLDLDALRLGPRPRWTDQSEQEYRTTWYLWRALWRDDQPTEAELWAKFEALDPGIRSRL